MDIIKVLESMDAIDDESLKKALSYQPAAKPSFVPSRAEEKERKSSRRRSGSYRSSIVKWGALAACFCLLVVGAVALAWILPGLGESDFIIENQVLISYRGADKHVVVPDNVVCIADYAFKEGGNAGRIETVCLGKEVAEVQPYAFDGCVNLNAVTLSESNAHLQQKNNAILSADGTQLIFYNGNQGVYEISDSVKTISAYAFANTEISELILPEVVEIADMAFWRNESLKRVYAPKVVFVGKSAFASCWSLELVTLPLAEHIGESAFEFCRSLATLDLPSAKRIDAFAFRYCSNLKVLQIPNVETVGRFFVDNTSISALLMPKVTAELNGQTFDDPRPVLWGYRGSALEVFANQYGFSFVDITDGIMPEGFAPVQDYVVCGAIEAPLYKAPNAAEETAVRYLQPGSTVDRIATNDTWSLLILDGERLYIENKYLKDFSYSDPTDSTEVQTYGDFQYLEYEDHVRIYHYIGQDTEIVIPATINQKKVTELYYSFLDAQQCSKVVSISSDTVEEFILSGSEKDLLYTYRYHCLKKLSMPSLRTLPDNAFYECLALEEVNVERVERIGSNVFACASFTELYVPHANRISSDAFKKTEIRTLHGTLGSYVESWTKENGYGFVDMENDYLPEYDDLSVDPADLIYYPVVQSEVDGKAYGYQGVSIAHDRKGNLYLYVDDWDTYVKTPFKQYVNYAEDTVNLMSQTAAVCGDYVWLIAPNQEGLESLSIVRVDKNGNQIVGKLEMGDFPSIENLACHFSDEKDGKLMFSYFDGNISFYLCLYETHDGGITWTQVASESLPHSIGAARMAENYRAMGFVNDRIGFVSRHYKFVEDPAARTWLTFDGGKTWERISVQATPQMLKDGYGETVALRYDGGDLVLTVAFHGGSFVEPVLYEYISADKGLTWTITPLP